MRNESNHNNVLYVVFYHLFDDINDFSKKTNLPFLSRNSFIEKSGKNVLAGAHKKFYRIQHPEIYLLDLKVQYKHKMKLPLDMVSKRHSRDTFTTI